MKKKQTPLIKLKHPSFIILFINEITDTMPLFINEINSFPVLS